jgi:HAD superfamily hydrolase (TIGR01549 family)
MDPVDGIGFDLDHTLAIDNRLERVAFLRLLERLLREGGRPISTYADEIDGIDELLDLQRHGGSSINAAVDRFVADHGLSPKASYVEAFRTMTLAMVEQFVIGIPGVHQTLLELRGRGIPVAVLTNGWSPLQQRKAGQAGFHGPVLVSDETGERKPSQAAFARLIRELDTPPAHTWFVGDTPESDVAGAHDAGLRTIWFNWERKEYPSGIPKPQHTITAFDELLALLPDPVRAS